MYITNSNFSLQFIILLSKRKTRFSLMLHIELDSVTIIDDDKRRLLLSDININIERGKIYTILGKNGTGKSTLIKSITRLLSDTYLVKGSVEFNGIDLLSTTELNLRQVRRKNIRYVFQDTINSLDPLKKIKYYFDISNVSPLKIEELLLFFQLPSYKNISGLHSYELSGGMSQRLLIVLALLANPDLLILDEPTSGVDYVQMNLILLKMQNFVRDKDKSVLIVTQDINFAMKISDCLAYLSDGRLTKFYTPHECIVSPDDKMKKLFNSYKKISDVSA